jgi:hypothetical protein
MTKVIRRVGGAMTLGLALSAASFVAGAGAGGSTTGPVISLNRSTVTPGDGLLVTVKGFTASAVTVSVCGNEARRGSSDCNMIKSKGVGLDPGLTVTVTAFEASAPPVDCPCVVRVSNVNGDEVAVAPITLLGHPSGPLVSAPKIDGPFVAVAIEAKPEPRGAVGWIRANLGGPFRYAVTVNVKNLTPEPLHQAAVSGFVSRKADENLASLDLSAPGEIGVGQTWTQTVLIVVPAPSFGGLTWWATVSGAGPTVTATSTSRHRPVLLLAMAAFLVVDLGLLTIRFRIRRRVAKGLTSIDDEGAITQATGLATA